MEKKYEGAYEIAMILKRHIDSLEHIADIKKSLFYIKIFKILGEFQIN